MRAEFNRVGIYLVWTTQWACALDRDFTKYSKTKNDLRIANNIMDPMVTGNAHVFTQDESRDSVGVRSSSRDQHNYSAWQIPVRITLYIS